MLAVSYERFGPAAEVLQCGELPDPTPGPGEVLVRVHTSGVNPSDVKTRAGLRGDMPVLRIIPHNDGAGVIEAVGDSVDTDRVGQRVWLYNANRDPTDGTKQRALGTAAQYVTVPENFAVCLPAATSFADGACLGVPAMTAHRSVFADGPVEGQTVLVTGGAGAVGYYAIQLAKWGGAVVFATVSSEEKAEHARTAGADHVIDYRREDVAARVLDITGGAGLDRIVEVDFGGNLETSLKTLKRNGVIAAYASMGAPKPTFDFYSFMVKNAILRQVYVYDMPESAMTAAADDIVTTLEEGRLRHLVAATFGLADAVAAHEAVEGGRVVGNVVVEIG